MGRLLPGWLARYRRCSCGPFGWKSVAIVAEHPAAHEGKAGNPLAEDTTPGIGAPVLSVVRSVL